MSTIVFPETRREVAQRIYTDIQSVLPNLDASIRESIMRALANGEAGRIFDLYVQQKEILRQIFPSTSTEFDYVQPWGVFKKITLNDAAKATGFITTGGTITTLIPEGTEYTISSGETYQTIDKDYEIEEHIFKIIEMSRSGNTVTFKTEVNHNLATNISVTISGVDQTDYNGTFTVTVISEDEAQYTIPTTPAQPTGTAIVTYDTASIKIEALTAGADSNLSAGAKLTLKNAIAGVNNDAYVQFTEIGGGAPTETFTDYQARVIDRYQNPNAWFSIPFLVTETKKIAGNTKVWGFATTPVIGDVTIYFIRGNDPKSVIPNLQEVTDTKNYLLTYLPANMEAGWLHVEAPSPKTVNFVFGIISPDSIAMRNAIKETLKTFFREDVNVSENILEDAYRSAIWNTVNPETNERIDEFSLASPVGDISIADGEIGVLGNVDF